MIGLSKNEKENSCKKLKNPGHKFLLDELKL